MEKRAVTDCDVIADAERKASRVIRSVMGNVQNRTVLNIGSRADANNLNIAPHCRLGPNAGVITQMNIAHNHRCGVNHDPIAQAGCHTEYRSDIRGPPKIDVRQNGAPAMY